MLYIIKDILRKTYLYKLEKIYVRDLECLTINKTPTLSAIGKFAEALEIDIRQLFDDVEIDFEHKK